MTNNIIDNEKVYVDESTGISIKYIFIPYFDDGGKDKLIISFSGFGPRPLYNYMKTLSNITTNKLYILDDFGHRGGYYIGSIGKLNMEKAVLHLIQKIINDQQIERKDVVC